MLTFGASKYITQAFLLSGIDRGEIDNGHLNFCLTNKQNCSIVIKIFGISDIQNFAISIEDENS
jgi:hypothetical protein